MNKPIMKQWKCVILSIIGHEDEFTNGQHMKQVAIIPMLYYYNDIAVSRKSIHSSFEPDFSVYGNPCFICFLQFFCYLPTVK